MILLLPVAHAALPAPIANGLPTTEWPTVGAIYAFDGVDFGAEICTATLVSAHGILTASHCADHTEPWTDLGYRIYFLVGNSVDDWTQFAEVEELVPHPDWDIEMPFDWDLGVGRLDAELDGLEPLQLGMEPADDAWIGQTVTIVGWGSTDTLGNGAGTKRLTTAVVDDIDDANVRYDAATSPTCPGDSGGPMLREQPDGTFAVDGVVSWGTLAGDTCGPVGGAQRLDVELGWVTETLASFEPATTTTDSTVPARNETEVPAGCGCRSTPSVDAGWIFALGLAAMRRRRCAPRQDRDVQDDR